MTPNFTWCNDLKGKERAVIWWHKENRCIGLGINAPSSIIIPASKWGVIENRPNIPPAQSLFARHLYPHLFRRPFTTPPNDRFMLVASLFQAPLPSAPSILQSIPYTTKERFLCFYFINLHLWTLIPLTLNFAIGKKIALMLILKCISIAIRLRQH